MSEFNTVRREKKSLFALFKAAAGEIQSNRDCNTYTNFIRDLGIESSSIQGDLIISDIKGQLILKCLFGIYNSPQKLTKKFDFTTMVPQVELFPFVFWEN